MHYEDQEHYNTGSVVHTCEMACEQLLKISKGLGISFEDLLAKAANAVCRKFETEVILNEIDEIAGTRAFDFFKGVQWGGLRADYLENGRVEKAKALLEAIKRQKAKAFLEAIKKQVVIALNICLSINTRTRNRARRSPARASHSAHSKGGDDSPGDPDQGESDPPPKQAVNPQSFKHAPSQLKPFLYRFSSLRTNKYAVTFLPWPYWPLADVALPKTNRPERRGFFMNTLADVALPFFNQTVRAFHKEPFLTERRRTA